MARQRFTEEQIGFVIRQHESGTAIVEIVRKLGISEQTFYRWKKKFAVMGLAEVCKLKSLEEENKKLKQLVADLTLDKKFAPLLARPRSPRYLTCNASIGEITFGGITISVPIGSK
ncbi:Transposase [Adhaeretor mobilis]|uniref:Transposase n=1 Tax=Adhaeretor mobilis TaxID=1930276 RepID=A0A517N0C8_9BACT|nr:Transposase [Adhaeretor mobilis]